MSESRKTGVRPKLTALVAAADEGGAVQGASRAAARPAIACRLETASRSARSRPMRLCSIRFLPTAARFLTTRSRTPDIQACEGYLPRDPAPRRHMQHWRCVLSAAAPPKEATAAMGRVDRSIIALL